MEEERKIHPVHRTWPIAVLLNLLMAICFLFSCLSFSETVACKRDSCAKRYSALGGESDNGYLLSQTYADNKITSFADVSSIKEVQKEMMYEYYDMLSFLTLVDQEGSVIKSAVTVSGNESSFPFSVLSLATFTNTTRFEEIKINLYKQVDDERLHGDDSDGVVYVPDYYANSIISLSGGSLRSFDDIIKGNVLLSFSFPNLPTKVYRVCNVFEVIGFDKTEDEKSSTNGGIIRQFLGNYMFIVDSAPFLAHNTALSCVAQASQFVFKKSAETIIPNVPNADKTDYFTVQTNVLIKDEQLSSSVNSLYKSDAESLSGVNYLFLSLFFLFFIPLAFFSCYYLPFKRKMAFNCSLSVILTAFLLLVFQIIDSNWLLQIPLFVLSFSNVFANCFVLLFFVVLFSCRIASIKVKKE